MENIRIVHMYSKEVNKIKKDGFAFIYVLIVMVPIVISTVSLIEIAATDYNISNNVLNGQQAFYNAEIGIKYEMKRLNEINFMEKSENYYLYFNDDEVMFSKSIMNNKSFANIEVNFTKDKNKGKFVIISKGNYYGFYYELKRTVFI